MESECIFEHAGMSPRASPGEISIYLHPAEIDISECHGLIALRLLLKHAEPSGKNKFPRLGKVTAECRCLGRYILTYTRLFVFL